MLHGIAVALAFAFVTPATIVGAATIGAIVAAGTVIVLTGPEAQ